MKNVIELGSRAVEQFVKGDVVSLKSQSPAMTVIGNQAGDSIVAWFVPPGHVQTAKFPPQALEKYTPLVLGQGSGDSPGQEVPA